MKSRHPILYFDGVCNLCNASVKWIIKRDKKAIFRFASLQSQAGQVILQSQAVQLPQLPDSVILEVNGKVFTKSTAVIKTLSILGGVYKLSVIAWLVPQFIRDAVYDYIARNRYKWYGKKDACMVPTPELKSRFLD